MDVDLLRKLQIGFMDFLSVEKRHSLIVRGVSISEILEQYPGESDHLKDAEDSLKWLCASDLNKVCWYGERDYPSFKPVSRRIPYMLFYKGTFKPVERKAIAVVGTRHVDNDGLQASFKVGLEAAVNEISVVSGLADGCDQASLHGAVSGNYPCYGIIGCGLEVDYPSFSFNLKKKMIDGGGAVISRFPPMYPPLKQNFPNRNLIIAAMGNCTAVVQAPKKSGSLITADMTLQLGKDVLVSEAGLGNSWCRTGSNRLAEDGACVFDSLSEVYVCKFRAYTRNADEGIRFGNKHYFIESSV